LDTGKKFKLLETKRRVGLSLSKRDAATGGEKNGGPGWKELKENTGEGGTKGEERKKWIKN